MHHPKNEGVRWHDREGQDQFQQCDGVYVQWHHFVDECGEKKFDEQYHIGKKILRWSETRLPNQFEQILF